MHPCWIARAKDLLPGVTFTQEHNVLCVDHCFQLHRLVERVAETGTPRRCSGFLYGLRLAAEIAKLGQHRSAAARTSATAETDSSSEVYAGSGNTAAGQDSSPRRNIKFTKPTNSRLASLYFFAPTKVSSSESAVARCSPNVSRDESYPSDR